MPFVFDAFGNDFETQTFCHADNCSCNCRVIRVLGDITNKRAVDFELADGKLPQIAEVGISGPKIVDCQRQSLAR